jgi:hypothetical protein
VEAAPDPTRESQSSLRDETTRRRPPRGLKPPGYHHGPLRGHGPIRPGRILSCARELLGATIIIDRNSQVWCHKCMITGAVNTHACTALCTSRCLITVRLWRGVHPDSPTRRGGRQHGGRNAVGTPGSGVSRFGILEGCRMSATPPGSVGDYGARSGGVAALNPRLLSGKPAACSLADPQTNYAPAPNRRPRFLFGALAPCDCLFSAPPASPAAVGEAQRRAAGA